MDHMIHGPRVKKLVPFEGAPSAKERMKNRWLSARLAEILITLSPMPHVVICRTAIHCLSALRKGFKIQNQPRIPYVKAAMNAGMPSVTTPR